MILKTFCFFVLHHFIGRMIPNASETMIPDNMIHTGNIEFVSNRSLR